MRVLIVFFLSCISGSVWASNGAEILKEQCASCHDLTGPAASTLKDFWARKGPDLF